MDHHPRHCHSGAAVSARAESIAIILTAELVRASYITRCLFGLLHRGYSPVVCIDCLFRSVSMQAVAHITCWYRFSPMIEKRQSMRRSMEKRLPNCPVRDAAISAHAVEPHWVSWFWYQFSTMALALARDMANRWGATIYLVRVILFAGKFVSQQFASHCCRWPLAAVTCKWHSCSQQFHRSCGWQHAPSEATQWRCRKPLLRSSEPY